MKLLDFDDLSEGFVLPAITKQPITQVQIAKFAGASGDFNPIHLDSDFAQKNGLESTISHGMLVMGIIGQLISSTFKMESVQKFSINFIKVTKPGDILTVNGTIKKKYELDNCKYIACELFVKEIQSNEIKASGQAVLKFN